MRGICSRVVLLFAFVPLLLSVPTPAIFQAMDVMTLAPGDDHRIGDSVTLTTHVFNHGAHRDASLILVHLNRWGPNERGVEVTLVGTGRYLSTFQIEPTDVSNGVIEVTVDAVIGTLRDLERIAIAVESLDVEVSATPARAPPGTSVHIAIQVRERGIPKDANVLSLTADVLTVGGPPESRDLAWDREDVGQYRATFVVPTTIDQNTMVSFVAWASLGEIVVGEALIFVDVPRTLIVWSHEVLLDAGEAVLEILASNETGWPETNATVALSYVFYDARMNFWTIERSGTTDERGAASFILSFEGSRSNVGYWGTVSTKSSSQRFSGTLDALPNPERLIEVRRENPFDVVPPGEIAALRYLVLHERVPLPSQTIYYYARAEGRFVGSGEVRSDDAGRFSLELVTPAGYTIIEFAYEVGGLWVYDRDVVFGANRLAVSVGDLHIGSTTHLAATLPKMTDAPWVAYIAFRPYRMTEGAREYPWSLASGPWGPVEVAVSSGVTFEHDLVVPRFLPKGEDYLLYILAFPHRSALTAGDLYVYMQTVRLENRLPLPSVEFSPAAIIPGSVLKLDASGSVDEDGVIEAFEIDWGDGTSTGWTGNATATHVYRAASEYTITVRLRDDNGAVGERPYSVRVQGTDLRDSPLAFSSAAAISAIVVALVVTLWHQVRGTKAATTRKRRRGE